MLIAVSGIGWFANLQYTDMYASFAQFSNLPGLEAKLAFALLLKQSLTLWQANIMFGILPLPKVFDSHANQLPITVGGAVIAT